MKTRWNFSNEQFLQYTMKLFAKGIRVLQSDSYQELPEEIRYDIGLCMALNIEDSHPDLSDEDVQKIAHAFRDSGITPAGSALLLSHLAWLYEKMAEGNNPIDLISYGRDMHKKSVRDLIICVEIIARKGKGQSIYRAQKEIAEREGMSVTNVKTIWKRRPVLLRDTSLFDSAGKLGGNAGD